MNVNLPKIPGDKEQLLPILDIIVDRLFDAFMFLQPEVREFVDTTAASEVRYLPDGNNPLVKDYYYVKTDSSANTVTITAFGSQTIQGAATYVLAAQYDRASLRFDRGTQRWYITS